MVTYLITLNNNIMNSPIEQLVQSGALTLKQPQQTAVKAESRTFEKGQKVNWLTKSGFYFGLVSETSNAQAINVHVKYKNNSKISGVHCVQADLLTVVK